MVYSDVGTRMRVMGETDAPNYRCASISLRAVGVFCRCQGGQPTAFGWLCLNQPKQAIAACTKIINSKKETKEDRAWAYSNRGVLYDTNGDLDRALADYNEAIRLDPKFADAYRNRGDIWLYRGAYDRAMSDLDAAIRLNPKDDGAYNSRGVAYYFKGDLNSAILEFDQAIKLARMALYYSNRGESYIDQGKYEEANSDIASAIELDPKLSNSFANRARLHVIKGETISPSLISTSNRPPSRLRPCFRPARRELRKDWRHRPRQS